MADQIKSLEELAKSLKAIEAAVVAEDAVAREPVRDALGRSYATGKRKDAVARVWIKPGSGKVVVNGKEMNAYFARPVLQMILRQPFRLPVSKASSTSWRLSKVAVCPVRPVRSSTVSPRRCSFMIPACAAR